MSGGNELLVSGGSQLLMSGGSQLLASDESQTNSSREGDYKQAKLVLFFTKNLNFNSLFFNTGCFVVGDLVWAKYGKHPYWPSEEIIQYQQHIFCFCTHKVNKLDWL